MSKPDLDERIEKLEEHIITAVAHCSFYRALDDLRRWDVLMDRSIMRQTRNQERSVDHDGEELLAVHEHRDHFFKKLLAISAKSSCVESK